MNNKEVRVTWEDITTYHSACNEEDIKELKTMLKRTHGLIVRDDKKYICVASEITEDKTYREVTIIPKANVKRIYIYPKGKKDRKDW